ncbi:MAG TPA: hypothetical protein VN516_09625, partial [Candidatus Baltobacteraceae bacterium]|nr:hypothetical protein [Candidatus Baltobacteraceae bacterium]
MRAAGHYFGLRGHTGRLHTNLFKLWHIGIVCLDFMHPDFFKMASYPVGFKLEFFDDVVFFAGQTVHFFIHGRGEFGDFYNSTCFKFGTAIYFRFANHVAAALFGSGCSIYSK